MLEVNELELNELELKTESEFKPKKNITPRLLLENEFGIYGQISSLGVQAGGRAFLAIVVVSERVAGKSGAGGLNRTP